MMDEALRGLVRGPRTGRTRTRRGTRAALAIAVGLLAAGVAAAGPLAPRRASDLVTLQSSGAGCALDDSFRRIDQRVLPDGSAVPFELGAKEVLVVTGVDWIVSGAPVDDQMQLFLYIDGSEGMGLPPLLYSDRGHSVGSVILDSRTISPTVVKGPLCTGSSTASANFIRAVVHGFVAKDK